MFAHALQVQLFQSLNTLLYISHKLCENKSVTKRAYALNCFEIQWTESRYQESHDAHLKCSWEEAGILDLLETSIAVLHLRLMPCDSIGELNLERGLDIVKTLGLLVSSCHIHKYNLEENEYKASQRTFVVTYILASYLPGNQISA